MTDGAKRDFKVRALGEIAIRCADLERMAAFYQDIIGLEHLYGDHRDGIIFFKIAKGFDGHTSVLALFHHDAGRPELHPQSARPPATGAGSSLHHLALSLPFAEQDAVMRWYDQNSVDYRVQVFDWIGWRGIFAADPEGNTVELVAYDRSLLKETD
jgi:catechol 2,3-dioxygenase-like lactoylglutathione lyase family enzyme